MTAKAQRAAVGFRVKSGWAVAVLLAGPSTAPSVVDRRRVDLADPAEPDALQPYHQGLDRPGAGGHEAVARLVKEVERYAAGSLAGLIRQYRGAGHRLVGVGIVAGSVVDPATIANEHIRAHAAEGRLFREVIERAARTARLRATVVVEKQLLDRAAKALRRSARGLKDRVSALGQDLDGSWRAEDKAAALVAWMALGSRRT